MEKAEKTPENGIAEKKIFSMLGLAARARNVASGEFMTERSVKEGHARLVIVATDASENTQKMFRNMCAFYKVPYCTFSDKNTLGHYIGKEFRASLAMTDDGMAQVVMKHLCTLGVKFGE